MPSSLGPHGSADDINSTVSDSCRSAAPVVSALAAHFSNTSASTGGNGFLQMASPQMRYMHQQQIALFLAICAGLQTSRRWVRRQNNHRQ